MLIQPLVTDCSRDREAALIDSCVKTGSGQSIPAENRFIAGVYNLSSLLLASRDSIASKNLLIESKRYFSDNPSQIISVEKVVASSALIGLSRFSLKLSKALGISLSNKTSIKKSINFEKCLIKLFTEIEAKSELNKKVKAYLCGDAAAYFYTRNVLRPNINVDFEGRFHLSDKIFSIVELHSNALQLLYFDINYNPNIKLFHEDYRLDATRMDLGLSMIEPYILAPVDLAVSKVLSVSEYDKQDVADIIRLGLASRQDIINRGMEAINSVICNQQETQKNFMASVAVL